MTWSTFTTLRRTPGASSRELVPYPALRVHPSRKCCLILLDSWAVYSHLRPVVDSLMNPGLLTHDRIQHTLVAHTHSFATRFDFISSPFDLFASTVLFIAAAWLSADAAQLL